MSTMKDTELAMECYRAFNFAIKAMVIGLDLKPSSADYMKVWKVVNEVADGKATLNVSPAEVLAGYPDSPTPAMKKHVQESLQQTVRTDQELAKVIVAASKGLV
jgi:hypothetical protein